MTAGHQFYPDLRSWLLRVNCNPDRGMDLDPDFCARLACDVERERWEREIQPIITPRIEALET